MDGRGRESRPGVAGEIFHDKPDGESGNRKLAIGCMYCDYKVDCWKDANDGKGLRKFDYKNGDPPLYPCIIFKSQRIYILHVQAIFHS